MVVSAEEMNAAAHSGAAGASLEAVKAQCDAIVVDVKPPDGEASKGVMVGAVDMHSAFVLRPVAVTAARA